jgi:hypothetical protein
MKTPFAREVDRCAKLLLKMRESAAKSATKHQAIEAQFWAVIHPGLQEAIETRAGEMMSDAPATEDDHA